MKLEYIVKCDYFGTNKIYNKIFYSDSEYNSFKNWIKSKRGYTNIHFLKKELKNKDSVDLEIKQKNKTKKDSLKSYLISNKKEILFFKFIYCLIYNDEIVYVGKTINIQSRISTHKKDDSKIFNSFSIISKLPNEISDSELLKLEEKYIKLLKPKYNIMHNVI